MPLEQLVQVIERLRERIQRHRALLTQNEALTRYVLVDPLLRALGWDTEDPNQVRPEFNPGHGRADYALMAGEVVQAMIEAKALDRPLSEGLPQGINYCLMQGTRYFVVTDGQRWELYETHRPVPIAQKRVVAFDLQAMPPFEDALKALALWRPNLESTSPLVIPEQPVVGVHTGPKPDGDGTVPLREYRAKAGTKPPAALHFPDGSEAALKHWKEILIRTCEWLVAAGKLKPELCPIRFGEDSIRYIVHTVPIHSNGSQFHVPYKLPNGVFIETSLSAEESVEKTKRVLAVVGQDLNGFALRIA